MVAAEGKDGELGRLGPLIDEAETVGLMATPDHEDHGHEYGVWGTACLEGGSTASLVMLEEVASACAGVAACLHVGGLGALELAGSKLRARRVAVAVVVGGCRFPDAVIDRPPPEAATIQALDGGVEVLGTTAFMHAVPGWDGCVVYGAGEGGWQRALVRRDGAGVEVAPAQRTMGLAAIETVALRLSAAKVCPENSLAPRSPRSHLTRHLLGLAAIALGNARGAVAAAREYAEQRYQGGGQIESHAAVQSLIGDAASRVEAGSALLHRAAEEDVESAAALPIAAAAKLRLTVDCCQAVTDSLQVFGGYGYMEDYGLEKRLRDAMTLKTVSLAPDGLRRMVALGGGR
jgi:alkylation response protein AidB-like acyl-CoA dehydrogenase